MWKLLTVLGLAGSIAFAADPGVKTYRFDTCEIVSFQDAPGGMPLSIFRGADAAAMKKLVPRGTVPSSFNVFLIRKNGKLILVDTGNGGSKGTLLKKLQSAGISPARIDAVLLTHMHGDHIGGLLTPDNKAAFPNAAVYVAVPEKKYWEKQMGAALARKVLEVYRKQLKPFQFDASVGSDILARNAAGHTPGHTLFELGNIRFVGDLVHGAALQFPDPGICAVYDMNTKQAVAARRKVLDDAAKNNDVIAGAHLPYPGIGTVRKNADGTMAFVPLQAGK